jgi:hypothetical protein
MCNKSVVKYPLRYRNVTKTIKEAGGRQPRIAAIMFISKGDSMPVAMPAYGLADPAPWN